MTLTNAAISRLHGVLGRTGTARDRIGELRVGPQALDNAWERIVNHAFARHDTDADGRIVWTNDTFCRLTGYDHSELIGQTHALLRPGATKSWLDQHIATAPDLWAGEALLQRKDGGEIWLSNTIAAVRASDGTVIGYTCVSSDVTDARQTREELRRRSKLMQLGQLTATVAHEIRNPLGAIRTASFVLERKIKGQIEGVAPQLERINAGIQRCDKIITELLDVSRVKALKRQKLAVDSWLMTTIEEDCKGLSGSPEVRLCLNLGSLEASFDPDQLRQVIINLLSNAAEATAEKSRSTAGYSALIQVSTRLSGDTVEIIVSDNGPGIEPKNLKRIREPLFTTKSFGVGLGIPAIERILESHGGYLTITSVYGNGATAVAGFARTESQT